MKILRFIIDPRKSCIFAEVNFQQRVYLTKILTMAEHNELGKDGEFAAVVYLKESRYEILHTNWRKGHFELDIVAKTEDELVFVEVKTRSERSIIYPEDAVTNQKIRNIISAADIYIKLFDIDLPARFDIISIIGKSPNFEIEHIEDAFYPPINIRRW
jgi:putative endonuclease